MLYEDDFQDTDDELLTDIPEDEDGDVDDEAIGEEEDEEEAY
jgi:hypothetical protein